MKREEHHITYKSAGNRSQFDYLMWKRQIVFKKSKELLNLGESITTQHRLIVMKYWSTGKRMYKNKRTKMENQEFEGGN